VDESLAKDGNPEDTDYIVVIERVRQGCKTSRNAASSLGWMPAIVNSE
jgi:hypothetical protein